jgi:peptide/nickel transport system substrate-binding protein
MNKRIELCHRFQRILHEEQPYNFLFSPYSLLALSNRYKNVQQFKLAIPLDIIWTPKAEQLKVPGM